MEDKPLKGGLVGFLLTFFIGLIGFILCLCLGDEDCRRVSIKTFVACTIIGVVCGIIIACSGILVGVSAASSVALIF